MNIAGLRVRITIQRNTTVTDRYGNHVSEWQDYATCWANPSDQGGEEFEDAGRTAEKDKLDFTVRFSTMTAAVTAKEYRILFMGRIYDITNVNDMGFKRAARKFRCELVEG